MVPIDDLMLPHRPIAIGLSLLCVTTANPAPAQIVPDATLPNNSTVTSDGNTFAIDGGYRVGNNLFHSFDRFSLPTGTAAIFNNAVDVSNILNRVTGDSISNIDGTIRANGTANVFLLNPNGIVFGPNARLDMGGSFVGSTADRVVFSDGMEFSTNPVGAFREAPLLSVNVPVGLQIGKNPGTIVNRSVAFDSSGAIVGLQVPSQQTLSLVGGEIFLEGGHLSAPSGTIEVVAMEEGIWSMGSNARPPIEQLENVRLSLGASIDSSGEGGGSLIVRGDSIALTDGSTLLADTWGDRDGGEVNTFGNQLHLLGGSYISASTFGPGNAGDININTSIAVKIIGIDSRPEITGEVLGEDFNPVSNLRSGIFSFNAGLGATSNVNIETGTFDLSNGATVWTRPVDGVRGGNVTILAEAVNISGSRLSTASDSSIAGNINIHTSELIVQNQGSITTGTFRGQGGDLMVNASDSVEIIGSPTNDSRFTTVVSAGSLEGNGGNVRINTSRLTIRDGGSISSNAVLSGRAGNITINATESVELLEATIGDPTSGKIVAGSSDISANALGSADRAGEITIATRQLLMSNGGVVNASAQAFVVGGETLLPTGEGGNIRINATEFVRVEGASPDNLTLSSIQAITEGMGSAGTINIQTQELQVFDGGQVTVASLASGLAGRIDINAASEVNVIGSRQAPASIPIPDVGDGSISDLDDVSELLRTGEFQVFGTAVLAERSGTTTDSGEIPSAIAATSFGATTAGDVNIFTDELFVAESGLIGVASFGESPAGNLNIFAEDVLLSERAALLGTTETGDGGNVTLLLGDNLIMRRGSAITTSARGAGDGGNITIETGGLVALENSDITSNAVGGFGGNIFIRALTLIGIEARPMQTDESDITAFSERGPEFSGQIEIELPDVDPILGIFEVGRPIFELGKIIDPCVIAAQTRVEDRGTGGIAYSPDGYNPGGSSISMEMQPFPEPDPNAERRVYGRPAFNEPPMEARGWAVNAGGEIELILRPQELEPFTFWYSNVTCEDYYYGYGDDRPYRENRVSSLSSSLSEIGFRDRDRVSISRSPPSSASSSVGSNFPGKTLVLT